MGSSFVLRLQSLKHNNRASTMAKRATARRILRWLLGLGLFMCMQRWIVIL